MKLGPPTLLVAGTAEPGPRHNAGLPSLVLCPDGSLLLAHRVGTHKNSHDGTQFLWRSADRGTTWAQIPFPFIRTPRGEAAEFRTASLSDLGGGRIAMLLTWIVHPDAVSPLAHPQTEGILPLGIGCTFSDDNGSSWSPLREIAADPYVQPCGNGPIHRLPDGGLLAAFELYKHYTDPTPWSARSAVTRSEDDGLTWSRPTVVAQDPTRIRSFWDQHIAVLPDGSLLGLIWTDDRRHPGVSEIYRVRSRDSGKTWSAPEATGLAAQYCELLVLPDFRLMLLYVVRGENSAIRIAFSSDSGATWVPSGEGVLYAQEANDLARVKDGNFAAYLQTMGSWTFGWPAALALGPHEVLAAYYAGEGNRSSIYLRRIALP